VWGSTLASALGWASPALDWGQKRKHFRLRNPQEK
jgi:hypothetical protein